MANVMVGRRSADVCNQRIPLRSLDPPYLPLAILRGNLLMLFTLTILIVASFLVSTSQAAEVAPLEIRRFVAIDNVCAWPNLTVLKDGTIVATIFNQPSHGSLPGDVECWASSNGEFWDLRGKPAVHDPETNRMNVAAGLAKNGDLIVLASGWSNQQQAGKEKQLPFRDAILPVWVCRSSDGGRTWQVTRKFPPPAEGMTEYIPFGDIHVADDGTLRTTCYAAALDRKQHNAWMFRSDDEGITWSVHSKISDIHNETTSLPLGNNIWLAAARYRQTDIILSIDDGKTWQAPVSVTQRNQINGHLQRLKNGAVLLSYGDRIKDQYGVHACWSSDGGKNWSEPVRLARFTTNDCGYPSSVESPSGEIVTAYYAKSAENHDRYQMGVAIWKLPAGEKK